MNIKYSLISNIIIVLMVVIATIMMFTGFSFMGESVVLSSSKLSMFKYFTVDSNSLMGIISCIFIYFLVKKKTIPKWLYSLKLLGTVGVSLTFFTVVFYLAPTTKYGYFSMFLNANLFYHLLVPVLSMITFLFFEKTFCLEFRDVLIGMSSMILYGIFYLTNVFIHMEHGKVSYIYDWYFFAQGGVLGCFIVLAIMLVVTFLISYSLWNGMRKYVSKR